MQISHILAYYEAMVNLYCDAASIGFSVAHAAEFWLERWWGLVPVAEVEQRMEYTP